MLLGKDSSFDRADSERVVRASQMGPVSSPDKEEVLGEKAAQLFGLKSASEGNLCESMIYGVAWFSSSWELA